MLIFMRFLEGLGGGVTFPAMNVLISKWAPNVERSLFAAIIFGGVCVQNTWSNFETNTCFLKHVVSF